jgi:hypothetical protein
MRIKGNTPGARMTSDDRRLIVETLAEMKELKGEMKEFKEHVIGRVSTLEKKDFCHYQIYALFTLSYIFII